MFLLYAENMNISNTNFGKPLTHFNLQSSPFPKTEQKRAIENDCFLWLFSIPFLIPSLQYGRKPGGDFRNEAEEEDFKYHDSCKWRSACDDVLDGAVFADPLDDEEVHADWRRDEGEFHVDQEDDVEPDGVEAERLDDRIEHRKGNEDDGYGFQYAAKNQQHDVDAQHDDPAVQVTFGDESHECLRYLQDSQDVAEEHGADHDGEDHAGCLDGRAEDGRHILDGDASVNEECDGQCIDGADSSGFSRCEDAGVDAADDDDRKEESPDVFTEGLHLFSMRRSWFSRFVPGSKDDVADEEDRQERARYDAGHEELADGFIGDRAVQNHRNGRRDQDAERAACGNGADDEFPVIAALQHFRNGHSADGDGGSDGRSGNCSKDGTGEDGRDAKAAGEVAHPLAAEFEKSASHAARQHDLAHEDIERNGRQDVGVQRLVRDDRHLREEGHIHELDDAQDPCDGKREGDRHADNEEENDE